MIEFGSSWLALVALSAIILPIIIHMLLRRRRPPVTWPAIELLRRAVQRTAHKRRMERLLLLLARCFLIALAAGGIAAPYFGEGGSTSTKIGRSLRIWIDNGIASQERSANGTVLDELRSIAEAELSQLTSGDRVSIQGMADGTEDVARPTLDLASARQQLAAVKQSSRATDLPALVRNLEVGADQGVGTSDTLVLSAWRKGSVDQETNLGSGVNNGGRFSFSKPRLSVPNNIQVSAVEQRRLGTTNDSTTSLLVTLTRPKGSGQGASTISVTASDSKGVDSTGQVHFNDGQESATTIINIRSSSDADSAGIAINIGQDDQAADNTMYTVFRTQRTSRVGLLDGPVFVPEGVEGSSASTWIQRALEADPAGSIEVDRVQAGDLKQTGPQDLTTVVVTRPDLLSGADWEALARFLSNGHTVIVSPAPIERGLSWFEEMRERLGVSWRAFGTTKDAQQPQPLARDQPQHHLLRLIHPELAELCPSVSCQQSIQLDSTSSDGDVVLRLADGQPFIMSTTSAGGILILLAAAPELQWTDLPVKPLMVPLFQELVRESTNTLSLKPPLFVGAHNIAISGVSRLTRIGVDAGASKEVIVDPVSGACAPLQEPGLFAASDASGRRIGLVAVNIDRKAADISPVGPQVLEKWLQPLQPSTSAPITLSPTLIKQPMGEHDKQPAGARGKQLAGAFFILAVAAMGIETLLARRHSSRGEQA